MKARITDINPDFLTMSIPPELAARLSLQEGQEFEIRLDGQTLIIELPEGSVKGDWLDVFQEFESSADPDDPAPLDLKMVERVKDEGCDLYE